MTDFEGRMAALRQRFVDDARAQMKQVEEALSAGNWTALRAVSHSLSGRAGMFGFPELGEAGQALEEAIDADLPEISRIALCRKLIDLLRNAVR